MTLEVLSVMLSHINKVLAQAVSLDVIASTSLLLESKVAPEVSATYMSGTYMSGSSSSFSVGGNVIHSSIIISASMFSLGGSDSSLINCGVFGAFD